MPGKKTTTVRKKKAFIVYAEREEKQRIDRVRKYRRDTLSGYVLEAVMKAVERDEDEMRKKGLLS